MKSDIIKRYILALCMLLTIGTIIYSCGSDDSEVYTEVPEVPEVPEVTEEPVSPVNLDMNAEPFPYETLSEYNFFEGEMKALNPVFKVLPYDLNSSLFTDYAKKKRFVWMPAGVKASYSADGSVLEFPPGTVLIKNFYYDTMLPDNTTRIIETRLMIRKGTQWVFATYVWNDEQTEAYLNNNGAFTSISFTHNGNVTSTNYRVPSVSECASCHKFNGQNIPIGVKPQNLNKIYNYEGGAKNQLQKLVEQGYLDPVGLPQEIVSTIDWTDASKPLELRVRSYLDINCAHCHSEGRSCDYTPMRLAFSESTTPENLGVCVEPIDFVTGNQTHIVARGSIQRSLMYFRMNALQQSEMMPQVGRTINDNEGLQLIADWINDMNTPCP